VQAFQGLLQPSFDGMAGGMGGAVTSMPGGVMALESNPARLGLLNEPIFQAGIAVNFASILFEDRLFDAPQRSYANHASSHPVAPLPYAGIALPVAGGIRIGGALYVQGGGGGHFDDLIRATPTGQSLNDETGVSFPGSNTSFIREDLDFRFMLLKLTPGASLQILPSLIIGVGLDLAYARMGMERHNHVSEIMLPGGVDYRSDAALAMGGKVGFIFHMAEHIRLGYSFTTGLHLPMDGELKVDTYRLDRNRATGVSRSMNWPSRHSAGVSLDIGSLTISSDVRYIAWKDAFGTNRFTLEDAWIQTPFGFESNQMLFRTRWRDQVVIAVGTAYNSGNLTFRMGCNYGRTPMTGEGVSPMLGTTMEYHVSTGIGWVLDRTTVDLAVEYGLPHRVRGTINSDWALAHAVFSPGQISVAGYSSSKTTSVLTIYSGITRKL